MFAAVSKMSEEDKEDQTINDEHGVVPEDDKNDPFAHIRGNCPVCHISIHRNMIMCRDCSASGWYIGCLPMNGRTHQIKCNCSRSTCECVLIKDEESKRE
jgi:hypothetical protein